VAGAQIPLGKLTKFTQITSRLGRETPRPFPTSPLRLWQSLASVSSIIGTLRHLYMMPQYSFIIKSWHLWLKQLKLRHDQLNI